MPKTLDAYLSHELAAGHIDHSIRAMRNADGVVEFYIHASGHDSDTPVFLVNGTAVTPKPQLLVPPIG